jgi:hypothetical protein
MERKNRRPLALRDEGAIHPFRLSLPREVLKVDADQLVDAAAVQKPKFWQSEEVHLFGFSFAAFFTAFYLFIF